MVGPERIVAGVVLSERCAVGPYGIAYRAKYLGRRDCTATLVDAQLLGDRSFRSTLADEHLLTPLATPIHPGLDPVLAVESEGSDVLVLTASVRGGCTIEEILLRARRRRERLPLAIALGLALQIAEALAAAHKARACHGALHPRSLLVSPQGQVVITDFVVGLALTTAVARGADPAYCRAMSGFLAPELLLGDAPDARTDVYAAAAVLATLCTGLVGSQGEGIEAAELQSVVRRGLETSPTVRCINGAHWLMALQAAVQRSGLVVASDAEIAAYVQPLIQDAGCDMVTEQLLLGMAHQFDDALAKVWVEEHSAVRQLADRVEAMAAKLPRPVEPQGQARVDGNWPVPERNVFATATTPPPRRTAGTPAQAYAPAAVVDAVSDLTEPHHRPETTSETVCVEDIVEVRTATAPATPPPPVPPASTLAKAWSAIKRPWRNER